MAVSGHESAESCVSPIFTESMSRRRRAYSGGKQVPATVHGSATVLVPRPLPLAPLLLLRTHVWQEVRDLRGHPVREWIYASKER